MQSNRFFWIAIGFSLIFLALSMSLSASASIWDDSDLLCKEYFGLNFALEQGKCVRVACDPPIIGVWQDLYCESGMLKQSATQTNFELIYTFNSQDRYCKSTKITIYNLVIDERCTLCPNPVVRSAWHKTQCMQNSAIYQRELGVYQIFHNECQLVDYVEYKLVPDAFCGFQSTLLNNLYIIILVLAIILLVIFRKKWM